MSEQQSIYESLGGPNKAEIQIRSLVETFYQHMDTLPEAKDIRSQHSQDLSESIQKLYLFLVGWTGGPQIYIEKFGHPRLRARHMPFKIGIQERDQWLLCMFKAIDDVKIPEPISTELKKSFAHIADFMRNQPEQTNP